MSFSEFPVWILGMSIVVLTAFSAYFSGTETAMMSLNRYRLRHLVKEKHRGARRANRMLRRPDRLLGVILVGNNLVNFTAATIAVKSPLSAVSPLRAAALALQPTPAHFTPLHAEFLKVCILSKCYHAAKPFLDQDLLQVGAAPCTLRE